MHRLVGKSGVAAAGRAWERNCGETGSALGLSWEGGPAPPASAFLSGPAGERGPVWVSPGLGKDPGGRRHVSIFKV